MVDYALLVFIIPKFRYRSVMTRTIQKRFYWHFRCSKKNSNLSQFIYFFHTPISSWSKIKINTIITFGLSQGVTKTSSLNQCLALYMYCMQSGQWNRAKHPCATLWNWTLFLLLYLVLLMSKTTHGVQIICALQNETIFLFVLAKIHTTFEANWLLATIIGQ